MYLINVFKEWVNLGNWEIVLNFMQATTSLFEKIQFEFYFKDKADYDFL